MKKQKVIDSLTDEQLEEVKKRISCTEDENVKSLMEQMLYMTHEDLEIFKNLLEIKVFLDGEEK